MEKLVCFLVLMKFGATQNILALCVRKTKKATGWKYLYYVFKTSSSHRCARCSACRPKMNQARAFCSLRPQQIFLEHHFSTNSPVLHAGYTWCHNHHHHHHQPFKYSNDRLFLPVQEVWGTNTFSILYLTVSCTPQQLIIHINGLRSMCSR